METRFRETPLDAGAARTPETEVASPLAVPAGTTGPMLLEGQVDAVLALQRTAGNQATGRAIGRKPDERTAEIERHADEVTTGVQSQDAAAIEAAFAVLTRLDIKLLLDVVARLRQTGALGRVVNLLPQAVSDEFHRNRIQSAIDAANGHAGGGAGDVEQLPENERDVVGEFGPAKPGTSGDDPEGNTYVVYDTHIKTYFMTKVEKPRRSSVWLANNPGNSDELGGMGLGAGMKWGKHMFAIYPTMAAGRKALWEKIQTKDTLKNYLNYHLGQKTDGTFPEGNDPDAYLKHIQAKAAWVQFTSTPKEIADRGTVEALLDGFMNAEGITEGNILTSGAQVSDSMTPSQQKTMTFYLKLLGIRAK